MAHASRAVATLLAVIAATAAVECRAEIPPPVRITTADQNGQGFLMTRLDRCLAVTAAHVMTGRTQASVAGLDERDRPLDGEAVLIGSDLEADVAVLDVTGPLTRRCGADFVGGATPQSLRVTAAAVLAHVARGGTVGREPLVVVDVREKDLIVAPPPGRDSFLGGFSGSLIAVDDRPAAMILAVVGQAGESRAIRYDRLMPIVRQLADNRAKPAPSSTILGSLSGLNLASATTGARVLRWSRAPSRPEMAATNLVDGLNARPWEVPAADGSAEVDLVLAGDRVSIISAVTTLTAGIAADKLPQSWEILVSADGESWALAWSGGFAVEGDQATVRFVPRRARFVRLKLRTAASAAKLLSIGPLAVLR